MLQNLQVLWQYLRILHLQWTHFSSIGLILVIITTILAEYCHNTCKYWAGEYTLDGITFKTYQVFRGVFSTFIEENDTFETENPLRCAYNEITKKYKSRQTILDFLPTEILADKVRFTLHSFSQYWNWDVFLLLKSGRALSKWVFWKVSNCFGLPRWILSFIMFFTVWSGFFVKKLMLLMVYLL